MLFTSAWALPSFLLLLLLLCGCCCDGAQRNEDTTHDDFDASQLTSAQMKWLIPPPPTCNCVMLCIICWAHVVHLGGMQGGCSRDVLSCVRRLYEACFPRRQQSPKKTYKQSINSFFYWCAYTDQLAPLSCSAYARKPSDFHLGGQVFASLQSEEMCFNWTDFLLSILFFINSFSLTLVESLSTLAVLRDAQEFHKQAQWIEQHISFTRKHVTVSVFEVNIRMLGGKLTPHPHPHLSLSLSTLSTHTITHTRLSLSHPLSINPSFSHNTSHSLTLPFTHKHLPLSLTHLHTTYTPTTLTSMRGYALLVVWGQFMICSLEHFATIPNA